MTVYDKLNQKVNNLENKFTDTSTLIQAAKPIKERKKKLKNKIRDVDKKYQKIL